jgi:hypothetical protein
VRRVAWPRFGQPSFVAEDSGPPFHAALWPEDNPVMLAAALVAVLTITGMGIAVAVLPHGWNALSVLGAVPLVACVRLYCKAARERQAMRDADRRWAREQGCLPPRHGWTAEAEVVRPVRAALPAAVRAIDAAHRGIPD